MEYDIYMLRCVDNSIYTGIAKDYKERFEKHKNKEGAKYTKIHKPLKIEQVFNCENRSEATKVEKFIKSRTKIEKELYIEKPDILIKIIQNTMKIKIIKKF